MEYLARAQPHLSLAFENTIPLPAPSSLSCIYTSPFFEGCGEDSCLDDTSGFIPGFGLTDLSWHSFGNPLRCWELNGSWLHARQALNIDTVSPALILAVCTSCFFPRALPPQPRHAEYSVRKWSCFEVKQGTRRETAGVLMRDHQKRTSKQSKCRGNHAIQLHLIL